MTVAVIETAEEARKWGDWNDPDLCDAVRDIERHLSLCKGHWGAGKGELMVKNLMKIRRRHRVVLRLPEVKDCLKPEKWFLLDDLRGWLDDIERFDFNDRRAKPQQIEHMAGQAIDAADLIVFKVMQTWFRKAA
jgi:hypothetical protein